MTTVAAALLSLGSFGPQPLTLTQDAASSCFDEDQLRTALSKRAPKEPELRPEVRLEVTLTATSADRIVLVLQLSTAERSDRRNYVVRRRDCPLIPRLVAEVWARFVADLPVYEMVEGLQTLEASWPLRNQFWSELSFSPGLADAGPRLGARIGFARGFAQRPGGALSAGYDVVPNRSLPPGRAWLHGLWIGLGGAAETRWGAFPLTATLMAAGGVALGVGSGFASGNGVEAFPLFRVRAAGRIAWPGAPKDGWRPHLGFGVEALPIRVQLSGPGGQTSYTEPLVRLELALGLSHARTRFP